LTAYRPHWDNGLGEFSQAREGKTKTNKPLFDELKKVQAGRLSETFHGVLFPSLDQNWRHSNRGVSGWHFLFIFARQGIQDHNRAAWSFDRRPK